MPPRASETIDNGGLRRCASESDMSTEGESPRNYKDYRYRRSQLIGMINWTHVLGTHVPELMILGIVVLIGQIIHQVVDQVDPGNFSIETIATVAMAIKDLIASFVNSLMEVDGFDLFSPAVKTTAVVLFVAAWLIRMENPIYLLSFATFKAPDSWKLSHAQIVEAMRVQNCYTQESLDFMKRILERSGTGQTTAWPPGIVKSLSDKKSDSSIKASREEAETVLFDIVEQALKKANVHPREIDVLVINCSLFFSYSFSMCNGCH